MTKITNKDIEKFIIDYMADPKLNTMKKLEGFAFDTPLVGFSSADDELYPYYKNHIDANFYKLPEEWLKSYYDQDFDPANVSVVSWVLPQTEDTRRKARKCDDAPTLEWERVRVYGEECNRDMAEALQNWLRKKGIEAIAPIVSPEFSWGDSKRFFLISNWSERHTAFISGLGTFGLCDGLITKKGKAVRYGSVILNVPLTPTEREYTEYNEYCQAKNGCRACINRCPADAITLEGGHNKELCQKFQKETTAAILKERYNYDELPVCGLCQTGVPCEASIPEKLT